MFDDWHEYSKYAIMLRQALLQFSPFLAITKTEKLKMLKKKVNLKHFLSMVVFDMKKNYFF